MFVLSWEGEQGYRGDIGVHTEVKKKKKREDRGTENAGPGGGLELEGGIDGGMEDEPRPSGQRRGKMTDGNLKDGSTETQQVG